MIVICDVDETVCSLHEEWLRLYRDDWGCTLTPNDVTRWEIDQLVKPECGRKIFDYLNREDLYENILPIDGALEGIKILRQVGNRVVFVTSTMVEDTGRKFKWLVKHGFLDETKEAQKDYVECRDKGTLIKGDLIIDDYAGNLKGFTGFRILFDRPHNRETMYDYEWRAQNWREVLEGVHYYEQSVRW